jgi:hypothetical protein
MLFNEFELDDIVDAEFIRRDAAALGVEDTMFVI